MTTDLAPTPDPAPLKGIERLPSGRWRMKLRDPTRPGRWMPGGDFPSAEEAQDYRRGVLAELAAMKRADEEHVTSDSGSIPEAAILALQEAVEGMDLLQLARDLQAAEGRLRPRVALSLAMEALAVVRPSVEGADSADSADSEAAKCL